MLKDYLNEKKFPFTEKLVDMDEAARTEMMSSSKGFLGVPFTTVTLDDGRNETVLGFDKGKINSTLGIQE
jgi:glutaredoxin